VITGVIIPAAGLGTRLRPLTDTCAKEMLPLGGRPLLVASLLEALAANVSRVVVVVSPAKQSLLHWLTAHTPAGLTVDVAVQPEPRGVLDAVARGAALLPAGPYAVLYPDYVHLPDQTGLAQLLRHADPTRGSLFAVHTLDDARAHRFGATARVTCDVSHRITAVAATPSPHGTATHTVFAEVRGEAHLRALAAGPLDDGRVLPLLQELARAGQLHGLPLTGEVLDLGVRAGYDDAVERFTSGTARWRDDARFG
jgi:UTP-glucose-1-phosphate uridylyltransferase